MKLPNTSNKNKILKAVREKKMTWLSFVHRNKDKDDIRFLVRNNINKRIVD